MRDICKRDDVSTYSIRRAAPKSSGSMKKNFFILMGSLSFLSPFFIQPYWMVEMHLTFMESCKWQTCQQNPFGWNESKAAAAACSRTFSAAALTLTKTSSSGMAMNHTNSCRIIIFHSTILWVDPSNWCSTGVVSTGFAKFSNFLSCSFPTTAEGV